MRASAAGLVLVRFTNKLLGRLLQTDAKLHRGMPAGMSEYTGTFSAAVIDFDVFMIETLHRRFETSSTTD